MSDLRERLIAAKLAGSKTDDGYVFRTNEQAADAAVAIFAAWLRHLAAGRRERLEELEPGTGHWRLRTYGAEVLEATADAIAPLTTEGEQT